MHRRILWAGATSGYVRVSLMVLGGSIVLRKEASSLSLRH